MAVALTAVALLLWWRARPAWLSVLGVAGLFIILGLVVPRVLAPVEWAWMKLAHYLGVAMTFVLVTLTFFLVITPVGLFIRLRKDSLGLKFDRRAATYWAPVEKDGPTSRPDKPY
jgi:hypothetical protein